MANKLVTVLEADGVTETELVSLDVGRQAAAASKSVAASTEDKAVLDAMAASLETIDGRVDGLETLISSTNTKLDTCITALQIIDNMVFAAGENHLGEIGLNISNPTSVLTRPADTTAYAINDLVASNTTAGSVAVPTVTMARIAEGAFRASGFRLSTNKTSGMDLVQMRARLWTTAPTYTNGDNGAYAAATGAAGYLGKIEFTLEQMGDGAVAVAAPFELGEILGKLASGTTIGWDLQTLTAFTPASGQTFTLTALTERM